MSLPTKPGNAERGWNDPPMILHNADGTTATVSTPPKRTLLNKRVAYPADSVAVKTDSPIAVGDGPPPMIPPPSSNASSTSSVPSAQGPPTSVLNSAPQSGIVLFPPTSTTDIPKFTAPIIVPTMNHHIEKTLPIIGSPTATNPITNTQVNVAENTGDDLGIPNFDDDTQMYHYTTSKLQKTLLDVKDRLQPKVVEVIQKKLEILSSMWESGSISYEVKSSMARLATALHRRRCDLAHDIHMSLMMDFVSEVGQWMVGVKRLIQEARGVEAPLSPTDTTVAAVNTSTAESSVPTDNSSASDTAVLTGNTSTHTRAIDSTAVQEEDSQDSANMNESEVQKKSEQEEQENICSDSNDCETAHDACSASVNNEESVEQTADRNAED